MSNSSYPSRFIINTDYATSKNDATGTATLTIPSLVNVAADEHNPTPVIYRTRVQIGASKSAGYRFYITSSRFDYAIPCSEFYISCTVNGEPGEFGGLLYRDGNEFVLEAIFYRDIQENLTYTDCGQTLTLHIQSFIDPFDT